ncbi:MAG: hypothetical protein ACI91B_003176, partial [Planctomycetota bacterium]
YPGGDHRSQPRLAPTPYPLLVNRLLVRHRSFITVSFITGL